MMTSSSSRSHLALLLLMLSLASATFWPKPGTPAEPNDSSKSPCMRDENYIAAESCSVVTLPRGFCGACGHIPTMQSDGTYASCTRVSGFRQDEGQCEAKVDEYIALNPCDVPRKDGLALYRSDDEKDRSDGVQQMEYFIYSMCEQACDCVPQENVDPFVKAVDVRRGNCQAHAFFDSVWLFPNVKLVRGEGDAPDPNAESLPVISPFLDTWFSLYGEKFQRQVTTPIEPEVTYFLERFVQATEIVSPDNTLWEECLYLESVTQGRVSTIEPISLAYPDVLCRPEATSGCPEPYKQVLMRRRSIVGFRCMERCVDAQFVDFRRDILGFECGSCHSQ